MENMFQLDLIGTGLKTAGMLFIVLGLLVLVLYIMKRFFLFSPGSKGDSLIRVVSSMHLAPKERIEVLEIEGERIVLGVTPGRISFLTKLDGLSGKSQGVNEKSNGHDIKAA